jgi:hypothetical protein
VPLIVIVLDAHDAVTPDGKFTADPAPVAPEVEWVIGVNAVFMHKVGAELAALTVLFGLTIIVPEAVFVPPAQPPVSVTV